MPISRLDILYRRLLISRFFEKGWGTPANLKRIFKFRKIISERKSCYKLIPHDYPIEILSEKKYVNHSIIDGKFLTPFELHLPGVVPKAAQDAYFQAILPTRWQNDKYKPVCIHLAGTGDHYFWRRRNLIAKPLLKDHNIGAIILENPFYGLRKPDDQVGSNLHNVSDIIVMGACLILECLVLLHWCERNQFGPLGITGLSMGGHMASLAATNWPKPLVLVPCLSWSTAAAVFTTGVLSQSINWDKLETLYFSDGQYYERLSKMVTIIDDAFSAGQKFIQNFNRSLSELKEDINEIRKIKNFDMKKELGTTYELSAENINSTNDSIFLTKCAEETYVLQLDIPYTPLKRMQKKFGLTKLMQYILPPKQQDSDLKNEITKTNWWEREALQFMRGMMDECTHLKNFSVPFDTSLIIAVCAKNDAYIPREGCSSLEEIWPGVEVRYLDAGHISAYVLHQKLFRSCIVEAFERAKKIYDLNDQTYGENLKPAFTYEELINRHADLLKTLEQC